VLAEINDNMLTNRLRVLRIPGLKSIMSAWNGIMPPANHRVLPLCETFLQDSQYIAGVLSLASSPSSGDQV
jgi:hypothetical protein